MPGFTILYGLAFSILSIEEVEGIQKRGFSIVVDNGRKATIRKEK